MIHSPLKLLEEVGEKSEFGLLKRGDPIFAKNRLTRKWLSGNIIGSSVENNNIVMEKSETYCNQRNLSEKNRVIDNCTSYDSGIRKEMKYDIQFIDGEKAYEIDVCNIRIVVTKNATVGTILKINGKLIHTHRPSMSMYCMTLLHLLKLLFNINSNNYRH